MLSEPEEDWLGTKFMDSCAAEVRGHVSLETVHQTLSKIPDSLAETIIAARDSPKWPRAFLIPAPWSKLPSFFNRALHTGKDRCKEEM